MKVYLAGMMENEYEAESYVVGIYSTKEKAEKAILNELFEEGISVLSLEVYEEMRENLDTDYAYWISEIEVE